MHRKEDLIVPKHDFMTTLKRWLT